MDEKMLFSWFRNLLDLLEKNSLLKLKFWISELLSNEPDCAVYVVGNKADDEVRGYVMCSNWLSVQAFTLEKSFDMYSSRPFALPIFLHWHFVVIVSSHVSGKY